MGILKYLIPAPLALRLVARESRIYTSPPERPDLGQASEAKLVDFGIYKMW